MTNTPPSNLGDSSGDDYSWAPPEGDYEPPVAPPPHPDPDEPDLKWGPSKSEASPVPLPTPPPDAGPVKVRGSLAPSAPSTGSLAHSLTKVTEGQKSAGIMEPGQEKKLEGGNSATVIFPETCHLIRPSPVAKLSIGAFHLEVTVESGDYVNEKTTDDPNSDAKGSTRPVGFVVLSLFGRQIAVRTTPTYSIENPPETIDENDTRAIEKVKSLLDPATAAQLDGIVSQAEKAAKDRIRDHQEKDAALRERESQPIYLTIGRGPIQDTTGSIVPGIVVTPATSQTNPIIALLTPIPIKDRGTEPGAAEATLEDIKESGVGFPVYGNPEIEAELSKVSREHLTIEIQGSKVRFIDGSGERSSLLGTNITL
jgi:hypothetical protein